MLRHQGACNPACQHPVSQRRMSPWIQRCAFQRMYGAMPLFVESATPRRSRNGSDQAPSYDHAGELLAVLKALLGRSVAGADGLATAATPPRRPASHGTSLAILRGTWPSLCSRQASISDFYNELVANNTALR